MGHEQESYLTVIRANADHPLQERIDSGPFYAAFGVGHEDQAGDAVERARKQAIIGAEIFARVKEQAVFALQRKGWTVRAIAEETDIPKSEVGRIMRGLRELEEKEALRLEGTTELQRDMIRAAWGHL
ncbi:helix-turn-helix domain-containing protein [Galactobacter valiniphilus]|uniref:helix-turn-helix domain-containing protein n=1 Tax=Galactobacter valiniphilus TaxID=2676122 RepID=UPI003736BECE